MMVEVSVASPPSTTPSNCTTAKCREVRREVRRSVGRREDGRRHPRPRDVRPRRGLAVQAGRGRPDHGRPHPARSTGCSGSWPRARPPPRGWPTGWPCGVRRSPPSSTAWSPAAWWTAARRTPTAAVWPCASPTRGSARWPRPTWRSTSYLVSIAGHLPDKEEAMALRSLELWGRRHDRVPPGPRPAADESAGRATPEEKVREQDRGQARPARPPDGRRQRRDRRHRHDGTGARGCRWRPTCPWVSRAATPSPRPPSTRTAPSRGSSGRRPIVMAHKVQFFSALIFSFLGLIIQVWIPKILQNGITNSLILHDAAAAQLRGADRRAGVCSRGSSATSRAPTSSRWPTPSSSTCATSSTSTSPGCRSRSTTGCSRGS